MVKRSSGLGVHQRIAKAAEKAAALAAGNRKAGKPGTDRRNALPRYLDGELYCCGDEVLEGQVMYYRPARSDEDSTDTWRLVVSPRGGGPTVSIKPSTTRAVKHRETT